MVEYIDNAYIRVAFDTKALNRRVIDGKVQTSMSNVRNIMSRAMRAAGVAATAAFGASFTFGATMAAKLETATASFTQLLGSQAASADFMAKLEKFAATTPTEFHQVSEAAKKLLVAGVDLEEVIPIMRRLGDGAALMDTLSTGGLNQLTRAMVQVQNKGKVTAEEMQQLAEGGLDAWDALAAKMGMTKAEAMDAVTDRDTIVKPETLFAAIRDGEGEAMTRIAGSMERLSKTLQGRWSTLMDTIRFTSSKVFAPLTPLMTSALVGVTSAIEAWQPRATAAMQKVADVFGFMLPDAVETEWIPTLNNTFVEVEKVAKPPTGAKALWQELGNSLKKIFESIGEAGGAAMQWLKDSADDWLPKLNAGFDKARLDYVIPFRDSVVDAMSKLKSLFTDGPSVPAPDNLDPARAPKQIAPDTKGVGDKIRDAFENMDWRGIGEKAGSALIDGLFGLLSAGRALVDKLKQIQWHAIGVAIGQAAIPALVGFFVGIVSMDFGFIVDLFKDFWKEILFGALMLVPIGGWLKPLGQILGRLPFVGPVLKWILEKLALVFEPLGKGFWRFMREMFEAAFPKTSQYLKTKFPQVMKSMREGLPNAFGELKKNFGKHMDDTAADIGSRMNAQGTIIKDKLSDLTESLGKLFGPVGSAFKAIGENLAKAFTKPITGIKQIFTNSDGSIRESMLSWGRSLKEAAGEIRENIFRALFNTRFGAKLAEWEVQFNYTFKKIGGAVTALKNRVTSALNAMREKFSNWVELLRTDPHAALSQLKTSIGNALDSLGGTIQKKLGDALSNVRNKVTKEMETLKNRIFETFFDNDFGKKLINLEITFNRTFNTIKKNITAAVQTIKADLTEFSTKLKDDPVAALKFLKERLVHYFGVITRVPREKLNGVLDDVALAMNRVNTLFDEGLEAVIGVVGRAMTKVGEAFKAGRDVIVSVGRGIYKAVVDFSAEVFAKFHTWAPIIRESLETLRKRVVSRMNELSTNVKNKVSSLTSSVFQKVSTFFTNMITKAREKLTSFVSLARDKAKEIGAALLLGIGTGLTDFGNKVSEWATTVKNKVVEAIKRVFDINSPSRVMMKIGESLIDGLLKPMVTAPDTLWRMVKESIGDVRGYLTSRFGGWWGGGGDDPHPGSVAATPQTWRGRPFQGGDITALGRWLQSHKVRVSEHPNFGGYKAKHKGAGHREHRALDLNWGLGGQHASEMRTFDSLAPVLRRLGFRVLWRTKGHYDHIHVESRYRGYKAPAWKTPKVTPGVSARGGRSRAYDSGGLLGPKPGWFYKDHTYGPERVLSARQNELYERHIKALEAHGSGVGAPGGFSVGTINVHEATDGQQLARDTMREFERIRRRQLVGAR